MLLLARYLGSETPRCLASGVRMTIIGRRDRLPGSLVAEIDKAERITSHCSRLYLRIAIDYSARDAILTASWRAAGEQMTRARFDELLGDVRPVDLLIRTGGEQRLSDFLLWESAYAELVFTNRMWPEFDPGDLARAVRTFTHRERRFGGVPQPDPLLHEHWLR